MTKVDIDSEARQRAIDIALNGEDRTLADQVRGYLKENSHDEAADAACYGLQRNAFQLLPWQSPPCCFDEHEAAAIVATKHHDLPGALAFKKLRRRGKSIWEPDLLRALA